MTKEAQHIALLFVAAEAHEDWEIVTDDDGTPTGVNHKTPGDWPDTPNELAEWFIEAYPKQAAAILATEAPTMH